MLTNETRVAAVYERRETDQMGIRLYYAKLFLVWDGDRGGGVELCRALGFEYRAK